jgi:hypothetical protein
MQYQNFGGVMMKIVNRCIALFGGSPVTQKMKATWGLEISTHSI